MRDFAEERYIPANDNDSALDPEELAWDHAMDISGSIYARLKELDMSQKELASLLGLTAGRVSQIIKGDPGMSIRSLAKIEAALCFDLGSGFTYLPEKGRASGEVDVKIPLRQSKVNERRWAPPAKPRYSVTLGMGAAA